MTFREKFRNLLKDLDPENLPTEVIIVDKKAEEKEEDKGGPVDAPVCNVPVALPVLTVAAEESESDLSESEDSLT